MSVQPSFIFGGNTGVSSPEELARLRAIADALSAPRAPKNVGEGLSAIGDALGYRLTENKADAMQKAGDASASSAVAQALNGGMFPAAPTGAVASPDGALPSVDVSKSAAGSVDPQTIYAGLKARGLNDAQAFATLGNWKQESEFRPGAVNPGEGAVGFTQWREGRKSSLENFAKATGRSANDPETQMDFYVREAGIVPDKTGTVVVDPGGAAFAKATDVQGANAALKGFIRYGSPYDKGGEGTRLANALAYQKRFGSADGAPVANALSGAPQGQQVASLDPSIGVPPQANPVAAALQLPQQAPVPQARPDVAAALTGAPAAQPGAVGGPGAVTPAGQRVLGQMMNPLPMGGNPMQMQPVAGADQSGKPQGPGAPGEIRKGADGKTYQYAQTTGMAGATGDSGWIETSMPAPQGGGQPAPDNLPVIAGGSADAVAPGQGGPSVQQLMQAAQNPWLKPEQRALINGLLAQKMKQNDPATLLEMEKNRLEMEKTRIETERLQNPQMTPAEKARLDLDERKLEADQNKMVEVGGSLVDPKTHQAVYTSQQTDWEKLDDRTLYNKRTGETKAIGGGANAGQFRFSGNSVEAQALNGLMDSGGLTPEQAQQLGAGKTITGPNGELIFMTPQGVFGQAKPGGPAIPIVPQGAPQQQAAPIAPQAPPPPAATAPASPTAVSPRAENAPTGADRPGMIPLTGAKSKPPNEQQMRDNKLYSVVAPELDIVEKNFSALSNPSDQALSAIPHGSDYGADYLKSPEYQRASNSLKTIIASYLYSVSGATAAPAEVENQAAILTPKPGEAKQSLNDKLARIRQMVDAIKTGGSGAPPAGNAGPGGGTTSNGLKWSIEP